VRREVVNLIYLFILFTKIKKICMCFFHYGWGPFLLKLKWNFRKRIKDLWAIYGPMFPDPSDFISFSVTKYDYMRRICVCGQSYVMNLIYGPHIHLGHKKYEKCGSYMLCCMFCHTVFYHRKSWKPQWYNWKNGANVRYRTQP
jgi:hypothetical protein